jgi:hypothetical protein
MKISEDKRFNSDCQLEFDSGSNLYNSFDMPAPSNRSWLNLLWIVLSATCVVILALAGNFFADLWGG